ncbi:MAG: DUF1207 domain-containing protein [Gemmatimonadaceae bacterium]
MMCRIADLTCIRHRTLAWPTRLCVVCAILLTIAAPVATPALAQNAAVGSWWFFSARRYYDPLIAEPRAAQLQALALAFSKDVPFLQEPGDNRRVWDIDLGAEFPILGFERGGQTAGTLGKHGFGAGVWLTVDFHMLEDLKDPSAPILNTDYRFSFLMLKGQYALSDASRVGLRAQMGHESTHLGDEYSLAARRLFSAFERINVSYEWIDLGMSYDSDNDRLESWTLRGGAISTLPFGDTYYKGDTLETAGRTITESVNSVEPYLGVQYRRERIALLRGWGVFVSLDARLRTVYDYHKASAAAAEDRQPSLNVLAGIVPRSAGRVGELGVVSPYIRYYSGVNPHGQFRNDRDYRLFGIGIRLDR